MGKIKHSEWWKSGVIYQIYPRSFHDTDNDGIGDLPGITAKLDYLAGLGIDAVWLSPVFLSPQYDFGYDIEDYRQIDSIFGTMDDMELLIKEAHRRDIRVIMDLVVNHTSHLHPWFRKSCLSRDNDKSDWYIWHEGKNGRPPNNWKSAFGGSAWEWDSRRRQFYLHSFLKEQPDLNWRNADVKKAVFEDVKFWLNKGVDGFRLDVANCYVKDINFRNNPFRFGPTPRPYDMQDHLFDRDRPETHDILKELRLVLDEFPGRMSVGEVLVESPGNPQLAGKYLGNGDDELHLALDFSSIYNKWSAAEFCRTMFSWYDSLPEKGWPALFVNNHDQIRSMSRYYKSKQSLSRAKVLAAMLLTLKGTPLLYYGEEIGMTNVKLKRKELCDPVGRKYWPLHPGRDGERSPMQWNSGPNAGFSGNKPWIRVNENYQSVNVEVQMKDPGSVYHFYRELISLRRDRSVLTEGGIQVLQDGKDGIFSYYRLGKSGEERIVVFLNFTAKKKKIHTQEKGNWKIIFSTHKPLQEEYISINFNIMPYEVSVFEEVRLVK